MTLPSPTIPDKFLQQVRVHFARYEQIQILAREAQRQDQTLDKLVSLLDSLNHLLHIASQAHDEVLRGLVHVRDRTDDDASSAMMLQARYEKLIEETQMTLLSIEQCLKDRQVRLIPELDQLLSHGKAARAYQHH